MPSRNAVVALGSVIAVLTTTAAAAGGKPEAARFVGAWQSEAGPMTSVTVLQADGRFTSDLLIGAEVAGKVTGKWALRGDALVWTYDGKPGEDVNPLTALSADEFSLREASGETSTFFRKGVWDPAAPELLPLAIGSGWVLQDDRGELTIRVATREQLGGHPCYRVDWMEGPLTYQSEYWSVRSDGVYAVGRRVMGKSLPFEKPYLLLKNAPTPGEGWKAAVAAPGFEDTLSVSVGARERVSTPAGSFEATPVVVEGRALRYRRWYAPGVGLVQEEASLNEGDPINLKKLKARLK